MSTDSDKQERSRLQHEAEHERPHKRSSVLLYLVILFEMCIRDRVKPLSIMKSRA